MGDLDTVHGHRVIVIVRILGVKVSELNLTLKSGEWIVIKFNLTWRHSAYLYYLLILGIREHLLNLGSIKELKCYSLLYLFIGLIEVLRKLDDHVTIAIRNNEALLEYKILWIIDSYESSRAISKIPQVVLLIVFIVLDYKVSLANTPIDSLLSCYILLVFFFLLCLVGFIFDHEVVVVLTGDGVLLLASYDSAPILSVSFGPN